MLCTKVEFFVSLTLHSKWFQNSRGPPSLSLQIHNRLCIFWIIHFHVYNRWKKKTVGFFRASFYLSRHRRRLFGCCPLLAYSFLGKSERFFKGPNLANVESNSFLDALFPKCIKTLHWRTVHRTVSEVAVTMSRHSYSPGEYFSGVEWIIRDDFTRLTEE